MVNGLVATQLELSVEERRRVMEQAKLALDEYKNSMVNAQKTAIAKLRQSLSAEKAKEFDNFLEPMLRGDGTLWNNSVDMLELSKSKMTYTFPKLPSIDEN